MRQSLASASWWKQLLRVVRPELGYSGNGDELSVTARCAPPSDQSGVVWFRRATTSMAEDRGSRLIDVGTL
jgi:hypothetical protein